MHFNRRINSMSVENGIELVDRNFNQFNHSMFAKCFFLDTRRCCSIFQKTHVSRLKIIPNIVIKKLALLAQRSYL